MKHQTIKEEENPFANFILAQKETHMRSSAKISKHLYLLSI